MIIPLSFLCIQFFSFCKISVFCVIEKQIFDMELLRQLTGIFHCGMMLLIRMEDIRLSVQTKGFVSQSGAVLRICFLTAVIRFVSATGQLSARAQIHTKSKLFCLGRLNIEKGNLLSQNFF